MATIHTLHIVNKPPDHPAFGACLSSITDQDGLLLTESGVLALAFVGAQNSVAVVAQGVGNGG